MTTTVVSTVALTTAVVKWFHGSGSRGRVADAVHWTPSINLVSVFHWALPRTPGPPVAADARRHDADVMSSLAIVMAFCCMLCRSRCYRHLISSPRRGRASARARRGAGVPQRARGRGTIVTQVAPGAVRKRLSLRNSEEEHVHVHRTIHLVGPEADLDAVARAVLGVSLPAGLRALSRHRRSGTLPL